MKRIRGIAVVGCFFLAIVVLTISQARGAGGGIVASVTGSGMITAGGAPRTFTVNAQRDSNNVSRGQIELVRHDTGTHFHADINCLAVNGNVATMSGHVTTTDSTSFFFQPGDAVWVQVVDNGHGANAQPDLISLLFGFGSPNGTPCTQLLVPANIPIDGGNITVH